MRQVGYLQILYREARSTERKKCRIDFIMKHVLYGKYAFGWYISGIINISIKSSTFFLFS